MRIAVIGRTEMLYEAAERALAAGHEIACVITATPSPESTRREEDFQALAARVGAPYAKGYRLQGELVDILREARPDIALAMNWPTLMDERVTEACGLGVVNSHGSDLPKYRGNACPNWAILCGEKEIGLTFHYVDPFGLDTGPVILKKFIDNNDDLYIGDVYDWLRHEIPNGFMDVLERVQQPGFAAEPQPLEGAIRAYPRKPSDGRIDWSRSMETVHRLVRASGRPFPGAFTFLEDGRRVTIWRAEKRPPSCVQLAVPGQLMYFENGVPVVACEDGGLALTEVTVEDGKIPASVRTRFV